MLGDGCPAGSKTFTTTMKKLMLMAAVLMTSVAAKAQNEVGQFTIAPTVGINLASTSHSDANSKLGLVIGATGEYGLTEKLSVTAALLYSMQGPKADLNYEGMKFTEKDKMNYLNVPILANYYVWQGLAVKAGVQLGVLLSAKEEIEGGGESASVDIKDACNTIDFAIPVGVSYEYKKFIIDARYNFGLNKILKEGESVQHRVFQLTVGYKFNL